MYEKLIGDISRAKLWIQNMKQVRQKLLCPYLSIEFNDKRTTSASDLHEETAPVCIFNSSQTHT